MDTKDLMSLHDIAVQKAIVVFSRGLGDRDQTSRKALEDAIESLQAENERLREMYAGLKKMVDDGSINERTYSAGLELERENTKLQTRINEIEQGEPDAYLVYDKGASSQYLAFEEELGDVEDLDVRPLYAHPAKTQPLTDDKKRSDSLLEMSLATIQALQAVSEEYNRWIRCHAAGGDYDDFLKAERKSAHGIGSQQ